jgi:aspartate/methionine/tyrosine aminotransferase
MAYVAFDRLAALKARAEAMIDVNRASYRELLGGHPRLDQVIFDQGTTVFPRLVDGDVEALATRLMETANTGITPGRFFARPNHFRVGLGGNPLTTRVGLERLAEALG